MPERTLEHGAQALYTFKRSQLGTTRSYEGLAEHGKRYIPKLAQERVPNAFGRLLKKVDFSSFKGRGTSQPAGRPSQQRSGATLNGGS